MRLIACGARCVRSVHEPQAGAHLASSIVQAAWYHVDTLIGTEYISRALILQVRAWGQDEVSMSSE